MPFIQISSPDVTDTDNRQTSIPLTNCFVRPNPNNAQGYVLESFPGLTKINQLEGKSRGADYDFARNAVMRVIGNKLYKGQSTLTEQVTIPNSDRVKMSSDELHSVVVTGGKSLYWDGSELKEFKNWSKGEQNAPLDGTAFDISGIKDLAKHSDFFVYIFEGRSGFGKTSPFRSDRPDAASFIHGAANESERDTALGITVLDNKVLLMSKRTCRFYKYATTGQYQESLSSRVEFSATGSESYCSWDDQTVAIIGAKSNESTKQQNGVFLLGAGNAIAIHTQYMLDEIAKQKDQEFYNS